MPDVGVPSLEDGGRLGKGEELAGLGVVLADGVTLDLFAVDDNPGLVLLGVEGELDGLALGERAIEGVLGAFAAEADVAVDGGDGIEVGLGAGGEHEGLVLALGDGDGEGHLPGLGLLCVEELGLGVDLLEEGVVAAAVLDGPGLLGDGGAVFLDARHQVFCAEAGVGEEGVVVPHGPGAAEHLGAVEILGLGLGEGDGSPVVVDPLGVEVVAVAADGAVAAGDDVHPDVEGVHDLKAGLGGLDGILPTHAPDVHLHAGGLHGGLAALVAEGAPQARGLALGADVLAEGVDELAIALVVAVILVRAGVDDLAGEDAFVDVLIEDGGDEGEGLGVGEVEHRGALHVMLAADGAFVHQVGADAHHLEGVAGDVELGDDGDTLGVGLGDEVLELRLGVEDVLGGEFGIFGVFEPEAAGGGLDREDVGGGLHLVRVPLGVAVEPDVVVGEVQVELVQLVVGADLGQLAEGLQGEGLAAAVEHEAALGVFRPVFGLAAGEGVALVREDLEDGSGAPEGAEGGGGLDDDAGFACGERVAFGVGRLIGDNLEEDVAGLGTLGGEGDGTPEAGALADERETEVVGKGLGVTGEGVAGVLGDDDAGVLAQREGAGGVVVAPIPELGDDEGLRAPSGRRRHQHRGKKCRFHVYSIALSSGIRLLIRELFLPACMKTQGVGAVSGIAAQENGKRKTERAASARRVRSQG